MPAYPKGSVLHMSFYCDADIDEVESGMIKYFDEVFKQRPDIGREYYEGNLAHILEHFCKFIKLA